MSMYVPKFGTICFELIQVDDDDKPKCEAPGEQEYKFLFIGVWSLDRHPMAFPENARFTDTVAVSHSDEYQLWAPDTTIFRPDSTNHTASFEPIPGIIAGSYPVETYLKVNKTHHYVSAVANVGPSPDWFIGISSIDVCDGYFWKDVPIFMTSRPWDSGIRDGQTFHDKGNLTIPQANITQITTDTMGSFYNPSSQDIQPLALVFLSRQQGLHFLWCDWARYKYCAVLLACL